MSDERIEDNATLEEKLDKLDGIIEKLESEEISLEEAFEKYSEGVKLVKECNASIDRVEKKVKLLSDDGSVGDFE